MADGLSRFSAAMLTVTLCLPFSASSTAELARHGHAVNPRFPERIKVPGIANAGKVNDHLYRGTQPGEKGLKHLRAMGVDTIVDLRAEFGWDVRQERHRAEKLDMRFVQIPGNGWSPPKDKQIAEFFSLVEQRRKIYVHCWFGGDRTGVFIATYRMAFDGWTPEQALAEMHAFRFHGRWHPAMIKYIRTFPARLRNSPVLARYSRAELRGVTDQGAFTAQDLQRN